MDQQRNNNPKRDIRNKANTSKKGQHCRGSREDRKRAQRLIAGAIAVAAAVGVVTKMARDANQTEHDCKQAIVMADEHRRSLAEYPLMQQESYDDDLEQVDMLNEAITIYSELKDKDRSIDEEQKYLEASRTICESKDLVIDLYTDTIKSKVAKAYGITDPERIEKIKVRDFINSDGEHSPNIKVGTLEEISSGKAKVGNKLGKFIIDARHLRDVDYLPEMQPNELPVDEIISTYSRAMKFGLNYDVLKNQEGKLTIIEREEKTQEENKTTNGNEEVEINYNLDEENER